MPALARVGVLSGARPLPVPFRGRDGGEVMRFFVRRVAKVGLRGRGRPWPECPARLAWLGWASVVRAFAS